MIPPVQSTEQILSLIAQYGYLSVFLGVMLESAGVPVPGETVLIAAGALVHQGALDLGDALFFGALGAVLGDQIGYWAGRKGGRPFVLRWGRCVFVTHERLDRAEAFFGRHGGKAVFLARFVTGLRTFGALAAGTSRMPWRRFVVFNLLGGVVWSSAAVALGYFLWASINLVEHWLGRGILALVAATALVLVLRRVYRRVTQDPAAPDQKGSDAGG